MRQEYRAGRARLDNLYNQRVSEDDENRIRLSSKDHEWRVNSDGLKVMKSPRCEKSHIYTYSKNMVLHRGNMVETRVLAEN